MDRRKPSILGVNLMYLLIAILFLTIGAYTQEKNIYMGIFITEYIILVVPIVIFMLVRKYNFKEIFRLNKISSKQVGITAGIVVLSYPVGVFLNLIGIAIINTFGEVKGNPIPTPETIPEFLLGLFLFSITPGICEEIMFRGFLMKAYEKSGIKKAIICTGILFGVFHFNLQNFLGPTYLGILFGYMVYKTNSLYIGMIGHAINNGIALILSWGSEKAIKFAESMDPNITNKVMEEAATKTSFSTQEILSLLLGVGIVATLCSFGVYALLKKLPGENTIDDSDQSQKIGILNMIPVFIVGILFLLLSYIYIQHVKF